MKPDVHLAPVQGVVAQNSGDYLRTIFSCLEEGRPVTTLRSPSDRERITTANVEHVVSPSATAGWVGPLEYTGRRVITPAQIAFTSGTEGASKGILLSHDALSNTADRLISVMEMNDEIREYVGVPVFHSFGFGRCRAIAKVGGRIYLPPKGFNPLELAGMLQRNEINAISAVPTLWRLVLSRPASFEDFGGRVRWIEIGSQSMGREEKGRLRALFPNAVIVQHYGLTEASRSTFLRVDEADEAALESVGSPIGEIEIELGSSSEIRIRGPHLASGMLVGGVVVPLADGDGWLTTSDEGYQDPDGFLHVVGRLDDVINCGGVKLSPDHLDRVLGSELTAEGRIAVARTSDELRGDGILIAYLESAGLESAAVQDAATRVLGHLGVNAAGAVRLVECNEFPTTATGKLRRKALAEAHGEGSARARTRPPYDPPRDEIERFLAECLGRLFGIQKAGVSDSILAAGADSLRTVELVSEIDARFGVELPLARVQSAPTVLGIADSVRWALAGGQSIGHKYVVPMAVEAKDVLPALFIVGGSYGNVLHLHDLAVGLGDVASVYGIQYRGLLDDDEPREALEELATDFLEEVLQVQEKSPYLLAGYSGGGIVALEMARQLLERGHSIRMLAMIDSRLPARQPYQEPFTFMDRQRIRLFANRRQGKGLPALLGRGVRRVYRKLVRSQRRQAHSVAMEELPPTKRRSERINAAFRRGCSVYEIPTLPITLDYFRPLDEPSCSLPSGDIDFVDAYVHRVNGADNGWARFMGKVEVHAVGGGHYTLAHAPHATGLAKAMRSAIIRSGSGEPDA